jgi:hypothetical protein
MKIATTRTSASFRPAEPGWRVAIVGSGLGDDCGPSDVFEAQVIGWSTTVAGERPVIFIGHNGRWGHTWVIEGHQDHITNFGGTYYLLRPGEVFNANRIIALDQSLTESVETSTERYREVDGVPAVYETDSAQ